MSNEMGFPGIPPSKRRTPEEGMRFMKARLYEAKMNGDPGNLWQEAVISFLFIAGAYDPAVHDNDPSQAVVDLILAEVRDVKERLDRILEKRIDSYR